MTPNVIGLNADDARDKLAELGYEVSCVAYQSRRGVDGADSVRVIRQRSIGHNNMEITVSDFKTQAG